MATASALAVFTQMKIDDTEVMNQESHDFFTAQLNLLSQQLVNQMDSQLQVTIGKARESLNYSITSITSELSNLQSSVNALNTTTKNWLDNLQSSVDTLNITTMGQQINCQSSVIPQPCMD